MNTKVYRTLLSTLVTGLALVLLPATSHAQSVTIVGPVTKIQLAKDGKSALAELKDGKSGNTVNITITDDLTLDKFKDKRIVVGDEIRARIDKQDGKNLSKSFKKTAGC